MFIAGKWKGKKKGKHSGWQQIRASDGKDILQEQQCQKAQLC